MPATSLHSRASPDCRLTWRPSRWVVAMLIAMGPLGGMALLVSDVHGASRLPFVACACLWASICAYREHRRPPRVFIIRSDGSATLDAMPLTNHHVHWRGTLAFLRARDAHGRVHRLAFWPDTLDARGRRALRLASPPSARPGGWPLAAEPREMRG